MRSAGYREQVTALFGERLGSLLGPYPDEVGWLLSAAIGALKVIVMSGCFWMCLDLLLPPAVGDRLAVNLIVTGLGAIVLAWLTPDEYT